MSLSTTDSLFRQPSEDQLETIKYEIKRLLENEHLVVNANGRLNLTVAYPELVRDQIEPDRVREKWETAFADEEPYAWEWVSVADPEHYLKETLVPGRFFIITDKVPTDEVTEETALRSMIYETLGLPYSYSLPDVHAFQFNPAEVLPKDWYEHPVIRSATDAAVVSTSTLKLPHTGYFVTLDRRILRDTGFIGELLNDLELALVKARMALNEIEALGKTIKKLLGKEGRVQESEEA